MAGGRPQYPRRLADSYRPGDPSGREDLDRPQPNALRNNRLEYDNDGPQRRRPDEQYGRYDRQMPLPAIPQEYRNQNSNDGYRRAPPPLRRADAVQQQQ